MTPATLSREARVAFVLPLIGYALWAIPAIAGDANRSWVAALLAWAIGAAVIGALLASYGAALLALLEKRAALVAVVLIVSFAAALVALNVTQAVLFAPGVYAEDTAYYAQVLWNTLHGDLLAGNVQQARLYDPPVTSDLALHVSPVLFAMLPIYAAAPDPLTLLIVRDIVLAAAAWPLFLIARDRLGGVGGVAAVLLYVANPAIIGQGVSAIYLLQFAPLPFFYAVRAFLSQRFGAFLVFTAIALCLREDVAITFGAFGILALVRRYPWRWVIAGCAIPVAWWAISTMLIQPAFGRAGNSSFDVALAGGEGDPLGAYRVLLMQPSWIWDSLTSGGGTYVASMLGWSAYVGVLGPEALLAGPGALLHLFLGRVSYDGLDVYARFVVLPASALMVATVLVVGRALTRRGLHKPAVCVAVLLLLPSVSVLDGAKDLAQRTLALSVLDNDAQALRTGLALIPPDAAVAAPHYALPSLANRASLYYVEELADYASAEPDYVLFDRNLGRLWVNEEKQRRYTALLGELSTSPSFATVWESGDYLLLRRRGD